VRLYEFQTVSQIVKQSVAEAKFFIQVESSKDGDVQSDGGVLTEMAHLVLALPVESKLTPSSCTPAKKPA
jgi:hypothetical protein